MDRISNVDLKEALTEIAKENTIHHLDKDLKISFEQMEMPTEPGDYTDNSFIWISYPAGIECYNEREAFQRDTSAYNGVQYHGNGAEHEPKLAYAVEIGQYKEGKLHGDIYEIDIQEYAELVRTYECKSTSVQIFYDDIRRKDKYDIIPLDEFNKRYPLDLPKMEHWRNLPASFEELDNAIDKAWDMRFAVIKDVTLWQHLTKLDDKQLSFYAKHLMKGIDEIAEPNSADKQSFTVTLDVRASHNYNPTQLSRILDKLPYENAVFAVQKGQGRMNIVVPKNEVLQLRQELMEDVTHEGEQQLSRLEPETTGQSGEESLPETTDTAIHVGDVLSMQGKTWLVEEIDRDFRINLKNLDPTDKVVSKSIIGRWKENLEKIGYSIVTANKLIETNESPNETQTDKKSKSEKTSLAEVLAAAEKKKLILSPNQAHSLKKHEGMEI